MLTDIHTHVFHPAVAERALARIAGVGFAPTGTGVLADLLARESAAGIERVLCLTAAMTGSQVRPANNFMLDLARRPKALPEEPQVTVFGTVHPEYEHWPEELDRLEKAGVRGLKLHPNFQQLAFDDPRLFPILEAVGSRFIILCHAGCEKPLETNPANPYKLAKLVDMFPETTFIAAHLGGYADGAVALEALAGKDVWLDTSNTRRLGDAFARRIVAKHPFERLLFGTDYPLFDPAQEIPEQQQRLGFSDSRMQALLANADALLG
ncbi:amidohydrolase family protein [Desulfovibrio sp. OttesenSCG-928-O18]|nr:amidohydrolase family protein [Desulfovibrio sp. OttesenSCG-928-O18]